MSDNSIVKQPLIKQLIDEAKDPAKQAKFRKLVEEYRTMTLTPSPERIEELREHIYSAFDHYDPEEGGPEALRDLIAILDDYERLRALNVTDVLVERDVLREKVKWQGARMEKAEAELSEVRSMNRELLRIYDEAKAQLEKQAPLVNWAEKTDASLLAHLTSAKRKNKCLSCNEAEAEILTLVDILCEMDERAALPDKEPR